MQEIDNSSIYDSDHLNDEHEIFMNDVVGEDHELLYLDTYLKEIFRHSQDAE